MDIYNFTHIILSLSLFLSLSLSFSLKHPYTHRNTLKHP